MRETMLGSFRCQSQLDNFRLRYLLFVSDIVLLIPYHINHIIPLAHNRLIMNHSTQPALRTDLDNLYALLQRRRLLVLFLRARC
jgi:hypothetical protein